MNAATKSFWDKVRGDLTRNIVTRPSKWAEKYRILPSESNNGQPWRWTYHPWLKEMHDTESNENVGQKAAQMGFTELVMNISFYCIDVKHKSVLYVLPAKFPDATDFSNTRFDPALELSPHLRAMFTSSKNRGVKRAGAAALYIRGSNSRAGLKSVPVSTLIFDELDEMKRESIALGLERVSGQNDFLIWMISTPTIEDKGINYRFRRSTQDHYFFPCPGCSRHIELTLANLVIAGHDPKSSEIYKSHLICTLCKKVLHHQQKHEFLSKARFVPSHPDRLMRGFYINQLYSSAEACEPYRLAQAVLESESDPAAAQELHNSKLGLTYRDAGTNISEEDVKQSLRGYSQYIPDGSVLTTMGIDVGSGQNHHWWIDEWVLPSVRTSIDVNDDAKAKTVAVGISDTFEELATVFRYYNAHFGVIDANPEVSEARWLADQFYGRMKLCYFTDGVTGKSIDPTKSRNDDKFVNVNRTVWFDTALGRFKTKNKIHLPVNIDPKAITQLTKPVRIYKKDKNGNKKVAWETADGVPDHYALARVYSEIALKLAVEITAEVQNIA